MINFERGFRRLTWVTIALSVPLTAYITYQSSSRMVGYEPRLLESRFPDLDETYKPHVELESAGLLYIPSDLSGPQLDAFMREYFTKTTNPGVWSNGNLLSVKEFAKAVREKHGEFANESDDVLLTKRVLTKYPVYRPQVAFKEYEAVPKFEKRAWYSAGVTSVVTVVLVVILQGGISVAAWVIRGFRAVST